MRILLADDHPEFLTSLQLLLTVYGLQVVGTATSGQEILIVARQTPADLLLMDISMPNGDGLMATRLIKAEHPNLAVVMLTASEDEQNLFEAIKSGAAGYLLKSQRGAELVRYLHGFQQGEAALAPGLAQKILQEFARQSSPPAAQTLPLTSRQTEILTLLAQGDTYLQIGTRLHLSEATVRYHLGEILRRLHLQNRAQVIAYAARMGLVPPPAAETEP